MQIWFIPICLSQILTFALVIKFFYMTYKNTTFTGIQVSLAILLSFANVNIKTCNK